MSISIKMSKRGKRLVAVLAALTAVSVIAACSGNTSNSDAKTQLDGQKVVNAYQQKATNDVPYPLAEMNNFLELSQQREKLLRFNDPAKIGYVYLFNPGVQQPIGYYTVKGKISNTDSQMTPTNQVFWTCKDNHGCQPVVVNSPSDDGSYGPNEPGVFFFTTEDVYVFVPTPMEPLYMDAPIAIFNVPQLNSASQKPTSVGETADQRAKNVEADKKAAQDAQASQPASSSSGK